MILLGDLADVIPQQGDPLELAQVFAQYIQDCPELCFLDLLDPQRDQG